MRKSYADCSESMNFVGIPSTSGDVAIPRRPARLKYEVYFSLVSSNALGMKVSLGLTNNILSG